LRPDVGDFISWNVQRADRWKTELPFQVELQSYLPIGTRVIRSQGGRTAPYEVTLPENYMGNFVFKYSVATLNGWTDDPDIVPVQSDGSILVTSARTVDMYVNIDGVLTLDPSALTVALGEVNWTWSQPKQAEEFTLTFDKKIPGWPQAPLQSAGGQVVAKFRSPGESMYRIVTQQSGLEATADLTVTVMRKKRRS
jgi:hypothetical protein